MRVISCHLPMYPSICLSFVCPSKPIYLYACLPACLSICWSMYPSTFLSLSIRLSILLSIDLSVSVYLHLSSLSLSLSIRLSLSLRLSIYLSIHPSVHLCVIVSVYLSRSLSLSIYAAMCHLCISASICVSLYLSIYVSIYLPVCILEPRTPTPTEPILASGLVMSSQFLCFASASGPLAVSVMSTSQSRSLLAQWQPLHLHAGKSPPTSQHGKLTECNHAWHFLVGALSVQIRCQATEHPVDVLEVVNGNHCTFTSASLRQQRNMEKSKHAIMLDIS